MKRNIKNIIFSLKFLLPAVAVAAIVAATVPATKPVLAEIPERLQAMEESQDSTRNTITRNSKKDEKKETEADAVATAFLGDFSYEDGVYTGSAQGYGGLITVQVTVENSKITAIDIIEAAGETEPFFTRAKTLIDTVLQSQTWEVDIVSGATYTSNGILGAIQNALTGEVVENEPAEQITPAGELAFEEFVVSGDYADGVYTGSAMGFGGMITVQVTISSGEIAAINIIDASGETDSYFISAMGVVSDILYTGSPNVDTVSGATYSSNGIINAVKRALNNAMAGSAEPLEIPEDPVIEEEIPAEPDIISPDDITNRPETDYKDGKYRGIGEGFGGDIEVEVTVENGIISTIDIVSADDETPSYFVRAKEVINFILKDQKPETDVVSGATFSSYGIMEAVQQALEGAVDHSGEEDSEDEKDPDKSTEDDQDGGESDDSEKDDSDQKNPDDDSEKDDTDEDSNENDPDSEKDDSDSEQKVEPIYDDGEYTVEVPCSDGVLFSYILEVKVIITDGEISEIEVNKIEDTSEYPEDNDSYISDAFHGKTVRKVWYEGVANQVMAKQSAVEVDVVSRATYSSNAIISGLQDILDFALIVKPTEPENSTEPTESVEAQEETGEKDSVTISETEKDSDKYREAGNP